MNYYKYISEFIYKLVNILIWCIISFYLIFRMFWVIFNYNIHSYLIILFIIIIFLIQVIFIGLFSLFNLCFLINHHTRVFWWFTDGPWLTNTFDAILNIFSIHTSSPCSPTATFIFRWCLSIKSRGTIFSIEIFTNNFSWLHNPWLWLQCSVLGVQLLLYLV